MTSDTKHKFFRRLSLTTLVAVYFLILVGGIVRSTGSGMGCPDWPKCFGEWMPPTSVNDLPEGYKEFYSEYRNQKNIRFAGILSAIGMKTTADKILNDESILVEADFNVYKTWTEYVNRIIGAVIGLLIMATMIASFSYRGIDNSIINLSIASFVLVILQGWIGSVVVSTNLLPWMVSIHMLMALLIVTLLIVIVFKSRKKSLAVESVSKNKAILFVILLCISTVLIQILMGTKVREAIDVMASSLDFRMRDTWVSGAGLSFLLHRSFSLIVLMAHVYLIYKLVTVPISGKLLKQGALYLMILVIVEIISGIVMSYFGLPPFIQPFHLLLSTLIFGLLVFLYLVVNKEDKRLVI
jgi:cytochrome c oxidase assembly protein subunit 15